jgi:hypothetical protein
MKNSKLYQRLSKPFTGRWKAYVIIAAIIGGLFTISSMLISEGEDYSSLSLSAKAGSIIGTLLGCVLVFLVLFLINFIICVVVGEPIAFVVRIIRGMRDPAVNK